MNESNLRIAEGITSQFKDIPAELFLESLATAEEAKIIRNTLLITDRDQKGSNLDFSGMMVHLGHGYLASALHCFGDFILIEDAPHSLPLKNLAGVEQRVEATLVASGNQTMAINLSRKDEDWIIFKVLPNQLASFQFPSFPLSSSPDESSYEARSLIAGVPGEIDLYQEGSGAFRNVGEQMAVRYGEKVAVDQLRSRIKSDMPPELVRQIRVNFVATGGYSGGPMIINQRLAGITFATNGNDLTYAIAIDYLLAQLRKKNIELLDE